MSIMGNSLRFLPAFVQMKRLLGEAYCGNLQVLEFTPPPKKEKNIGVYIQLKSRGQ